jgi:hypothetical protein
MDATLDNALRLVTLREAVLTSSARKALPSSAFVYPEDEKYPIHDLKHARNALARVSANGSDAEKAKVRAAVYKKYPQLKEGKEEGSQGKVRESLGERIRTLSCDCHLCREAEHGQAA